MKTTIFGAVQITIYLSVPLYYDGQIVCSEAADR